MFEQIGNLILSIDLLGLGASITFIALSIGIAYLVAKDIKTMGIVMITINTMMAIVFFVGFKESIYFLLVAIMLIIYLILPDDVLSQRIKEK